MRRKTRRYYYITDDLEGDEGEHFALYRDAVSRWRKTAHDMRNWNYAVNKGRTLYIVRACEAFREDGCSTANLTVKRKTVL